MLNKSNDWTATNLQGRNATSSKFSSDLQTSFSFPSWLETTRESLTRLKSLTQHAQWRTALNQELLWNFPRWLVRVKQLHNISWMNVGSLNIISARHHEFSFRYDFVIQHSLILIDLDDKIKGKSEFSLVMFSRIASHKTSNVGNVGSKLYEIVGQRWRGQCRDELRMQRNSWEQCRDELREFGQAELRFHLKF